MRILVLLIVGCVTSFVGAAIPLQPHRESHHYGDWEKGYYITLPEKWMIKRDFMGMDVFAAAPDKNAAQGSRANITIKTAPVDSNTTLEKFYNDNVKDHDRFLRDFKILQTGQINSRDFKAKKIEFYQTTYLGEKVRTLQYFVVYDNHGLIITYAGDLTDYPKYLEAFEQSLKTLQFR